MSLATKDTLSSIMSRQVRTISPSKSIKDAIRLMAKHDIGCIVVTDGSKVVGILTERDITRKLLAPGRIDLDQHVGSAASKPVVTADSSTKVWEAFALMLQRKFRQLPVVDSGKLVGIVTERDLFKWVVGVIYEPNIPADLAKLIGQSS